MENKNKKCIISGTSGFIGSRIKEYFIKNNWGVFELKHISKNIDTQDNKIISYTLGKELESNIFNGIDTLIHCAYDFKVRKWEDIYKTNVQGSIALLKAAKNSGVKKIIFISSIAAFEDCTSLYGKAKLEIEKEAIKLGATIIRPGLVYGKDSGGMFGALNKVTSITNIIPVIGNGNNIMYMVHINDLCNLIFNICTDEIKSNGKPITAAFKEGKTFKNILRTMVNAKGKTPVFIPIPYTLVLYGLKFCEAIGLKIRIRSDSLTSMLHSNTNPYFDPNIQNKIVFQEFNERNLNS